MELIDAIGSGPVAIDSSIFTRFLTNDRRLSSIAGIDVLRLEEFLRSA